MNDEKNHCTMMHANCKKPFSIASDCLHALRRSTNNVNHIHLWIIGIEMNIAFCQANKIDCRARCVFVYNVWSHSLTFWAVATTSIKVIRF